MEPFENDGIFWRPGKDNEQLSGRLKFDPVEGATLSLIGGFGDIIDQFTEQSANIRIHGVAGKRYLTLDGCFNTKTEIEMPGTRRQDFYVGFIIAGHLFPDGEEFTFDEFSAGFDQLPTWVRRSGVNVTLEATEVTQIPDRIKIDFSQPPDETVQLDDVELRLTSTWGLRGDNITETRLIQDTQLAIKYATAQPLEIILADVKALQDLLTLTTTAPTVPTNIDLWRADITFEHMPGEDRPQRMSYYAGQVAERVRLREPQSPARILFQFQDIGGLPTIARWIEVAREYDAVVNSLLSIRYSAGLYVQNRFHNVVSAAESFHRLRFANEVMAQEDFEEFLQELIEAVPEQHRDWLGTQLQYSNEPRLRRRLKELTESVSEAFYTVCGNPDEWVTVVVESRNRLIHHDKDREIVFERGDLYFIAESVFVLVMLCLFRECEVNNATLAAIKSTGGIQFLRGKLGEIIPRLHAQIEHGKTKA
jgi:ApeA N-terminal domain 1